MKWRALSPSLRSFLLLAALSFAPVSLFAQAQATTGVIRGTATDSSGNPIAAFVTVRNTQTNFTRTVKASDQGVFVTTLLPLGDYQVSARAVGYSPTTRSNINVTLGQTIDLPLVLARSTTQLAGVTVVAAVPTVDPTLSADATRLPAEVVSALPNNGRNYLNLTLLTPNVAVTQGPDGDVLSVGGQRGIHNNVSVDGADFNNPFFGEQRGGQRPPFTFNLDAVQEMVVVAQGANAEFGRSGGGFVNVITKSGTNNVHGTLHYFGKNGALSSDAAHAGLVLKPDFGQHQFGLTLGGPIVRDKFFYFVAYDQQLYSEIKQKTRPASAALDSLTTFLATTYPVLAGDFGPIQRTNDAQVGLVKLDWRINETHNASLKYNYTNSRQENGTFDVDTWARSSNAIERDYSNAVNGSLVSHLTNFVDNEFRFQLAREDRPRPYSGPLIPGQSRPFSDTGMDFVNGFRFGEPFFIPVKSYDTRIQALDNISWVQGNHLFKTGFEYNRTAEHQTFVGFANGRFIFNSVTSFENYVRFGNMYVECSAAGVQVSTSLTGACPAGTTISGPVQLYLQQAGVNGLSVEQAGTQVIPQQDIGIFIQDNWKATPNLTVNYGLRWEGQKEPDPITPPSQVFFAPFIGQTVTNAQGTFAFPSDGKIPSDMKMFQPRLGLAWDVKGDGKDVLRASGGLYYARIPGLNLASARSTNGSIGQTIFRNSALTAILGPPPPYNSLLPAPAGAPFRPDIFVYDKDFKNPRTMSASIGYEKEVLAQLAASITYTYAATDNLTRFVNRNDAVFGSPWQSGLAGTANGVGVLTVIESSAKSRYNGVTFGLGRIADPDFQFQANYTLSVDKSDDDNERDPFSFRYAQANRLDREYNYSDRDQRHRLNLWALYHFPWDLYANTRFSWYSAQPTSEKCINNLPSGQRATAPTDRICANGTILLRNTIRRDNAFASWDIRVSRPFRTMRNGQLEAMLEVFNVLNRDNFRDPSSASLLFNFDGTIRNGLGDPRQIQLGIRYGF